MDPFSADPELRPRAARKADFARFHNDTYPGLVALLHALHGDRGHAHRAAQRAFADTWLRWERVRSLPDPAVWTRHRARRMRPPRRRRSTRALAGDASEWIAPPARPIFEALSGLPSELRTVLALHHIGGLRLGRIADEENLPRGEVSARLADAGQALAVRMGRVAPDEPGPGPAAIDPWVARELADLAHALSYRTDRRAADKVFGQAMRHRVAVVAATVALVAIAGVGGLFALRQYVPGIPEAAPGAASPPGSAGEPTPPASVLPTPGIPPMSELPPMPAAPGGLPPLGALPAPGSSSAAPGAGTGVGEPVREVDETSGGDGHRDQAHGVRRDGVRPTATRPTPDHPGPPASTGSPHPPASDTGTTTAPPTTSPPSDTTSAPPPDGGPPEGGPSDDGGPGSDGAGESPQTGPDDQGGRPRTHPGGGGSQGGPNGRGGQHRAGDGQRGHLGGGPMAPRGGGGGHSQPGNGVGHGR